MAKAWIVDEYSDAETRTLITRWWYPLHDTWSVEEEGED